MPSSLRSLLICGIVVSATMALAEKPLVFPEDSGVLDVRSFGAKGDGIADDTRAILQALAASGQSTGYSWFHDKIVYIPDGTYKISAPLLKRYTNGSFASGMVLLGESREHTILKLADHAEGYGDPHHPRAMVYTTSELLDRGGPYGGGKDYPKLGEGNDAYENFVENMTIETGEGNAGAIGVDYLANNLGAMRNLNIVAGKGGGSTGIAMVRKWPGPAIIEHVTVTGFDVGIDVANTSYCMTLSDVHLEGQRIAGLRNHQNSLAVEDLDVQEKDVPALVNDDPDGLIVLVGGTLRSTKAAIRNKGTLTIHGTHIVSGEKIPGLPSTVALQGVLNGVLDGVLDIDKWKAADGAWKLTALKAPAVEDDSTTRTVSVTQFGALDGDEHDSTEAFDKALHSGAATVYIPHGYYAIHQPLDVPATVRHIAGMNSSLKLTPVPGSTVTDAGILKIGSRGEPLLIERLAFRGGPKVFGVESDGARDVVLRDIPSAGQYLLLRQPAGGRVFLNDVCCGAIRVSGPAPVIARQYDTEGSEVRIYNDGAPLWVLGIKTERPNLVAETVNGGHTEILGGLVYMVIPNPQPAVPMFHIQDASMVASVTEEAFGPGRSFEVYLQNDRKGQKPLSILRNVFRHRSRGGDGRIVSLLQSTP